MIDLRPVIKNKEKILFFFPFYNDGVKAIIDYFFSGKPEDWYNKETIEFLDWMVEQMGGRK